MYEYGYEEMQMRRKFVTHLYIFNYNHCRYHTSEAFLPALKDLYPLRKCRRGGVYNMGGVAVHQSEIGHLYIVQTWKECGK